MKCSGCVYFEREWIRAEADLNHSLGIRTMFLTQLYLLHPGLMSSSSQSDEMIVQFLYGRNLY